MVVGNEEAEIRSLDDTVFKNIYIILYFILADQNLAGALAAGVVQIISVLERPFFIDSYRTTTMFKLLLANAT